MIAGADLIVDAEARAHDTLAGLELLGDFGPDAALARSVIAFLASAGAAEAVIKSGLESVAG